jgi:hypothetical protein
MKKEIARRTEIRHHLRVEVTWFHHVRHAKQHWTAARWVEVAMENIHRAKLEARLQYALQQHFAPDHATMMCGDVKNQNGFCQFFRFSWRYRLQPEARASSSFSSSS